MSTTGLPPKESGYVTASCYDRNCTLAGIHERPIRQVRAWNSTIVNVSSFDTGQTHRTSSTKGIADRIESAYSIGGDIIQRCPS